MEIKTAFPSIAVYLFWFAVSYVVFVVYYRLYLHPLRSYPGPPLAKVTNSYALFHASLADLHRQTLLDHEKYGSVLRHGPDKLVFNSAKALQDIYHNNKVVKSRAYLASLKGPNTYNLFNVINKDLHRERRQLVAPVVNERSMQKFEPVMVEQIDLFIQTIRQSCEGDNTYALDMTDKCKYLGMDIVGLLAFGYHLRLQTEENNRFIIDTLKITNYGLNLCMQQPLLARLHLEVLLFLRAAIKGKSYLRTIEKMIRERVSQEKHAHHDFFSYVANRMKTSTGNNVWGSEIWTEAIFFLSAGGDTVSTALSAMFFYLSRNEDCYRRLASEIRSGFTDATDICGSRLSGCRYLRACIDETLRMSPPLPGTLWREEVTGGKIGQDPLIVDGHVVPPGTQIGVNIYALHHNEEYFPDPFKFYPERWLTDEPGQADRKAFAPFSVGSRSCAGKAMAYLEMSLVVAKTLWHFDFEKAPGRLGKIGSIRPPGAYKWEGEDVYLLRDIFVSAHDGPYLVFKPKETLG
ncbi:cytochrome P450 [Hypoxylon sp. FL1150]|nr:cytochrome P450 [Hypoxylon sp. FL1150]